MNLKEKQALQMIADYVEERKFAPTVEEIARGLGLASKSTAHKILVDLERKGFIERNKTLPRAIRVLKGLGEKQKGNELVKEWQEKVFKNYLNFGDFIKQKREEREMSLREMARCLGLSAPYMGEIEKDRKNPPDLEKLELIAKLLLLSQEEKITMLELAGRRQKQIAPDLARYILERDYVNIALRIAGELGAGEKEWFEIIRGLRKLEADLEQQLR